MANQKSNNKLTLLGKMTFAPEARSEDTPRPVIEGRFKYFFSLFKKNNNYLMIANLFFLIFCLPLLIVLVLPTIFGGMENIHYLLNDLEAPYFMTNIGIGLSSGEAVMEGRLGILRVNQLYYLAIACVIPFISFGAAGMFHITMKLVWQDSFITKKDTYGNKIPRIVKEFFLGVKKYSLSMLIIFTVFALLFASVSSAIVYFIQNSWQNTAGGGEWMLLIVAILVALISIMLLIFMLPMTPMYNLSLMKKLKNSIILIISMFIPAFFITVITVLPFLLVSISGGFIKIIITAALLVFGGGFYSLMWTNFVQYYADKIITPVYEAQRNKGHKKKKKNKK